MNMNPTQGEAGLMPRSNLNWTAIFPVCINIGDVATHKGQKQSCISGWRSCLMEQSVMLNDSPVACTATVWSIHDDGNRHQFCSQSFLVCLRCF